MHALSLQCCRCWTIVDGDDCFMLTGVGPMTVAMLMNNTLDSAKRALQMQKVLPTLRMGFSLAPVFPYLRCLIRKWYFLDTLKLLSIVEMIIMNLISAVCLWGMLAWVHRQIYGFVSQYNYFSGMKQKQEIWLVEHRTGIAEVTGSNPIEALIFFRLLLSNCLNWKIISVAWNKSKKSGW